MSPYSQNQNLLENRFLNLLFFWVGILWVELFLDYFCRFSSSQKVNQRGLLKRYNLEFIRWTRYLSLAAEEVFLLCYDHEVPKILLFSSNLCIKNFHHLISIKVANDELKQSFLYKIKTSEREFQNFLRRKTLNFSYFFSNGSSEQTPYCLFFLPMQQDLYSSLNIYLTYLCVSLKSNLIINKMAERRTWTALEDDALKALKDERKIRKWSQISRLLEVEFNIFGRNGKQCRQRYHNHLDDHITRDKWSREENQMLMNLHIQMGNRWASISRSLPGRTDNCVKNHFYSQFRKAIRIVNDLMKKCLKKCYKPIKPNFINKVIEITQSEHRKATMSEEFIQVAINLKEKVLRYSLGLVDEKDLQNNAQIHEIIQLLSEFNRYYRQKYTSKKLKKKSASLQEEVPFEDKPNQEIEDQIVKVKLEEVWEESNNCANDFQGFNADYLSLNGIGGFQENQNLNDSTEKHSQPSLIEISQIKHYESSSFLQFSQIHYEEDFNFPL